MSILVRSTIKAQSTTRLLHDSCCATVHERVPRKLEADVLIFEHSLPRDFVEGAFAFSAQTAEARSECVP